MPSADVDAGVLVGFVPLIISTAQFEPQSAFDQGSRYSEPVPTVTMWLGVPTYFAANLHAAHARRALTDELLDTGLTSTQQRTLALCLRVTARFLVAWALAAGLDKIIAARCDRLAGPCAGRRPHRPRRRPARRRDRPSTSDARRGASHHGRHRRGLRVPAERSNTLLSPYTDWSAWLSGLWMGVVPGSRPGTSSTSRRCASWPRAERRPHTASGVAQPPDPRPGRDEPPPCDDELGRRHPRLGSAPDLTPGATGRPRNYRAGRPACVRARHIQPRSSDLPALGLTGPAAAPRRGSSPVSCRHRRAPRP
jgi:hypothetical protein